MKFLTIKLARAKTVGYSMSIACCLLSFAPCSAQQGVFDVSLSLKSMGCKSGKAFIHVEFKVHDAQSEFNMGNANYRFT